MTKESERQQGLRLRSKDAARLKSAGGPAATNLTDWYVMKIRNAAAFSGIHPDTIRRWIRQGRIAVYGRPKTYRVNLKDLLPLAPRHASDETTEGSNASSRGTV